MRVFFDTVGCRLNQSEIEKMARQFRAAGHSIVSSAETADLVVINTCAVTSEAASDSRQKIRQAARLTQGKIIATGCWASVEGDAAMKLEKVAQVIDNRDKEYLVSNLLGICQENFDLEPLAREPLPGVHQRTRAFIKVQDGCDHYCTYCLTRIARGPSRSIPIDQILVDIQAALNGGVKEVVLTGVHLGSWGKDCASPTNLIDLIEKILSNVNIPRLRLSSLEPWNLAPEFFSLWKDSRLCRHFHLPLQSGCERTLRRMARNTTPERYWNLIMSLRDQIQDVAITTDVMVGFPGETEADFMESLEFVEKVQFAGGHVFNFSPRPATAAAKFPNPVPFGERKNRSARMRGVLERSTQNFYQQQIGKTLHVLWERAWQGEDQMWNLEGLSDNYLRVVSRNRENLWNQISAVKMESVSGDQMTGIIVPNS